MTDADLGSKYFGFGKVAALKFLCYRLMCLALSGVGVDVILLSKSPFFFRIFNFMGVILTDNNSDKSEFNIKNDRYAFLHDHAKFCFETELNRFKSLEDKASKQISLLALLITGFTALIAAIFKLLLVLPFWPLFFIMLFVVLTFVALFAIWYFYYKALGLSESERIDFDEAYIENFHGRNLPSSHYTLAKAYAKCINSIRIVNDEKAKYMAMAYEDMHTAVLCFCIVMILSAAFLMRT